MTALAVFCYVTMFFLMYRDLFVPDVRDVEVWFGFEVHGSLARATAPIHWALFGVGASAFWMQRPWALPAAAGYAFYVAASHLVWNQVSPNGYGWVSGIAQALAFSVPGVVLLRAHRVRERKRVAG